MAWTAPRTWVAAEVPTAAILNAHIRDNLLEQDAATATTKGDLVYADAANSMGSRVGIGADNTRVVSFASGPVWRGVGHASGGTYLSQGSGGGPGGPLTFTDFDDDPWGSGLPVAVSLTTGTRVVLHYGARYVVHLTLGQNVQLSYRVSGATTTAANSGLGTLTESDPAGTLIAANRSHYLTGLTAGVNTFTLQGLMSAAAASGKVVVPWILVKAL